MSHDIVVASGGHQSAVWLDVVMPTRSRSVGRVALARGTDVRPLAVGSAGRVLTP